MMRYELVESNCILDGEEHIGYGVKCDDMCLLDVTTKRDKMVKYIDLFNKNELDPIHLNEVIEDFFYV